jgi:hypothetical protein
MTPAITLLPTFLRDLERFTATSTSSGITLRSGHIGRSFDLGHHDKQRLVRALYSLADAVQGWAKTELQEPEAPAAPAPMVKETPYGPMHQPPADILMGTAKKDVPKPDIKHDGLTVEVKAKRSYTKRKKDV